MLHLDMLLYSWCYTVYGGVIIFASGDVCTKTAMHYFARFPIWQKIVVLQTVFCSISVHRFFSFRSPFL